MLKKKKYRRRNVTKSKVGDSYCALYEFEYNKPISEQEIENAKNDIIKSLQNLLESKLIVDLNEESSILIAQPFLRFRFNQVNIVAHPDLLVMYNDNSPMIIDWKVHQYANIDAWLQLAVYCYVFNNSNFRKKFSKSSYEYEQIKLKEYQLLRNFQRNFIFDTKDLNDIEDYIYYSTEKMAKISINKENMIADQLDSAYSARSCLSCNFKKLCWKDKKIQKKLVDFL